MSSLATKYLGLELKNPVILGSSHLSANLDSLKRAEDAGVGAVVLKSIFEEQISNMTEKDMDAAEDYLSFAGAYAFLENASKSYYIDKYLDLVQKAKEALSIPVIASINCTNRLVWLDYAKQFEHSGADALELNHYIVESDLTKKGSKIEDQYLKVAKETRKAIKIPLSMKLGWNFTSIGNVAKILSDAGIDGIVLFNHFFRPDIDIEKIEIDSERAIQPKGDWSETLRWTAIIASKIKADICSSTGIRDAETAIKMLLVGASAFQITSAISKNGYGVVNEILSGIESWMDRHNYRTVDQFKGKLSQKRINAPEMWERAQYIRQMVN